MDNSLATRTFNYYKYGKFASNTQMRRRIARMQKQITANKAETKVIQFTANATALADAGFLALNLTNIGQGDDSYQRTGRRICIKGVDIRLWTSDRHADVYLIKTTGDTAPGYTSFAAVKGAHLDDAYHYDLKELAYIKSMAATSLFAKCSRRFKGWYTYYSGTSATSFIKNGLYFCIKNNTGAGITYDYSINVYYTDA